MRIISRSDKINMMSSEAPPLIVDLPADVRAGYRADAQTAGISEEELIAGILVARSERHKKTAESVRVAALGAVVATLCDTPEVIRRREVAIEIIELYAEVADVPESEITLATTAGELGLVDQKRKRVVRWVRHAHDVPLKDFRLRPDVTVQALIEHVFSEMTLE